MATHEVFNQAPPLTPTNLYQIDKPLQSLLDHYKVDDAARSDLSAFGARMGSDEYLEKGFQANEHSPKLHTHDRFGHRVDRVEFHPAYHDLMASGIEYQLHALPWKKQRSGSHYERLALVYLHAQNEAGTQCPITMTFSCVPALKNHFARADEWLPGILSDQYDPADKPYFEKAGLTIGMAMTEKQGGTDVRANTTTAKALKASEQGNGAAYLLNGHKWFCSAPMCDAFLTLAQTEAGLSCFLLPRWRPDGSKNNFHIQRLKDKLGNRSNASSEVEFHNTFAWMIGNAGRGVATIIEMVAMTRYDCMIGASALMRRGVSEVMHHIKHRSVMGRKLIDQPLMRHVAGDLCLEAIGALALSFRAAECLEHPQDQQQQLLLRLLLPIGKYWLTKRSAPLLVEAMECLGGNGYVEQGILTRQFREAPVNAIWEGSGNVQCLDVFRAIAKTPQVLPALEQELASATGVHPSYDQFIATLQQELPRLLHDPFYARVGSAQLAIALEAAQLIKLGDRELSQAFCAARLKSQSQQFLFGSLHDPKAVEVVLERCMF